MKKRIMKCLLMGLLTAGMLLPCMSVKASSGTGNSETVSAASSGTGNSGIVSAASSGTFNEGVETEKNDIDRQIRELEGIQYSLGEQKEMAKKEYLRYKEEGKLKEAEEAYKRKESLESQIQGLDPQIGSLYSRKDQINGRSPIGTFVKLEGITSGEPYPLVVHGSVVGNRKVISTAQFTNPGTIRFTEDCDIENLHVYSD